MSDQPQATDTLAFPGAASFATGDFGIHTQKGWVILNREDALRLYHELYHELGPLALPHRESGGDVTDQQQTADPAFDLRGKSPRPSAFIQYKNTDICIDFYCRCGAHCHFDGYFAYAVKCPHCDSIWEMPLMLFPREAGEHTYSYWRDHPQMLEPDENLTERSNA